MPAKLKRIGIFGGSFDPPHVGHIIIAELAWRDLGLDCVFFVPAYRPPHKLGKHPSTAPDRLQMTKLAIRGNKKLRVSDVELRRKGVSYTVDTVKDFRRRFPKAELFLIVGSDSLLQFHSWKRPDVILKHAILAVYRRPRTANQKPRIASAKLCWIEGPIVDVSSSDVRNRLAKRKTVRLMVRDNVLAFIRRKHLYGVSTR